jgi:tetratricopeptide (TPR) repeat protein
MGVEVEPAQPGEPMPPAPSTVVCPSCGAATASGKRFCADCGSPLIAAADPAGPKTIANGRYTVDRLLGEGGRKRVYLAKDTVLDRDVALALIKAEGLDANARARVLREAQAMGRLGADPHVVAVFDLGEDAGQPYLVSELMSGGDLEGLLDAAPKRQLPIPEVIAIGQGICRGLIAAHARGLVHRDLKPGNVWLTAERSPKIGDFGLALALERSRLTQEGMIVGTVAYLPPEQALGGDVTQRADLYSLGCVLYECLTGRPPFLGDDPVAIISQHINTPAVAPSWHRADCPKALEALVLRLLAKDPLARPDSAADVLAALSAIEPGAAGAVTAVAPADERSLDALAGGVFVGRRKELETLRAALEDALSGRGRMVTLVGETGIGKTRTASELTTYARLRRAQVLWGRAYESAGAPPYWPFVQAMRGYVREREPEQLRKQLGSTAGALAEILPEIRTKLPDAEPPPAADPAQARFRLFDGVTTFLRAASQDQPMLLVLDDLHWADAGTLALLEFLARELEGSRLLILGTYRDVELAKGHPLAATLAELTRERLFERVLLRGLDADDVGRFIGGTANITPPEALVTAVYRHTEGNPLFVTEVVRLLVQEGALAPDKLTSREHWSVRIPDGVREVIRRRLERLSERCQETLRTAAVLGREFRLEQLAALSPDLGDERLLGVVEEALAARVVEELPRSVGRFGFTHALIQDTLVAGLSATRRSLLHAQIGAALEEFYGDAAGSHAAELAYHFGHARTQLGTVKFVTYSLVAGEQAFAAHAYEEAEEQFAEALAATEEGSTDGSRAVALLGLGKAQALTKRSFGEATDTLRRAFDLFADTGDQAKLGEVVLALPYQENEEPGAHDLVRRALELVPAESHIGGQLVNLHGLYVGVFEADYDGAVLAFESALDIARRIEDRSVELNALVGWTSVDSFFLRLRDCIARARAVVELARALGDERSEMNAHLFAFRAYASIGDLGQASKAIADALDAAEQAQVPMWRDVMESFGGSLLLHTGEWERARKQIQSPGFPLASTTILEYQVGNVDAASRVLRTFISDTATRPLTYHSQRGLLALVAGFGTWVTGAPNAFDEVAPVAALLLSGPVTPWVRTIAQAGEALAAVAGHDVATAERLYQDLLAQTGTIPFMLPLSVDHLLGLLGITMGRETLAHTHLETALTFYKAAGYRPAYGWAAADYAALLLDEGIPADHARGIALGNEALAIGRELGMKPLVERVLARREFLKA